MILYALSGGDVLRTLIKNAYVYSSQREDFSKGNILFANGKIVSVNAENTCEAENIIDARDALAIPGFVDVHTHGRAGYDFCSADATGLSEIKKSYLEGGVTSLMPTLASAPFKDLLDASDRINASKSKDEIGARFLGIHLEGRYLNPEKRGAHSKELLSELNADELSVLINRMTLPCHITSALELDTDGSFSKKALELGASLGLGHTSADYAQSAELYRKYKMSFSHLFNAMPPLHHRDGGAVCAALTEKAYCELICDGIHIAPEMIRLAYSCLTNKRVALITDSMEAAGCADGTYSIAGNTCIVKNGHALTLEGKLAGSTLNMKTALENLMEFCNIPLTEALRCATLTPAELVKLDVNIGSLEPKKFADILLVRESGKHRINIEKVICGGVIYD